MSDIEEKKDAVFVKLSKAQQKKIIYSTTDRLFKKRS